MIRKKRALLKINNNIETFRALTPQYKSIAANSSIFGRRFPIFKLIFCLPFFNLFITTLKKKKCVSLAFLKLPEVPRMKICL